MCTVDGQRWALLQDTSDASLLVHYFFVGGGYFSNIFEIFF
jgi:hypothetical protein